jgi:hypothetical protein
LRYLVSAILALVLMSAIPSAQAQECQLSSYYEHPVTLPKWGYAEEAAPAIEAMRKQLRGALGLNPLQQVADPGKAGVAVHVVADLTWGRLSDKKLVPAESLLKTVIRLSGEGVQQLRSPWLWMTETSECRLTIVLIWNTRQFLVDHAWADGVESGQRGIATSERDLLVDGSLADGSRVNSFRLFREERNKILIYQSYKESGVPKLPDKPCFDDQPPAFCPEAQQFPPELFWFYSHLEIIYGKVFELIFGSATETQGKIVEKLAADFMADRRPRVVIQSIREVSGMVDVSGYRTVNTKLRDLRSE